MFGCDVVWVCVVCLLLVDRLFVLLFVCVCCLLACVVCVLFCMFVFCRMCDAVVCL